MKRFGVWIFKRGGWYRDEAAPDAKHKSRIDWSRMNSVSDARQGVSELRERQNARNEEYRQRRQK